MKKNIRISIIGLVLVSASLFGAYWVQHYMQRSRASATTPTASFIIASQKVNPGDSFDLTVQINPNLTPFYSFDLAFTYDPVKVSLQNNQEADLLANITPLSTKGNEDVDVKLLTGLGNTSIDINTHTIRITGIRGNGEGEPFIGRDPIKIVKVSFVMNQDQELPLDFNWIDPDPTKTNLSDSFEKKNISYIGESPTTDSPIGATPTIISVPETVRPSLAYNTITPGKEATTTTITERKDLLYINSIASYQSPFRYEQPVKLEKGTYSLLVGAKVHVRNGRGMTIALICNDTTCGSKKKNNTMYVSPVFPTKAEFSEMSDKIIIPDDADNKEYIVRVYCEDGSECEIDYISLEDAWGTERLRNAQFENAQQLIDPRRQPADWELDDTANMYGSLDSTIGKNGSLMINNSLK